MSWGAVHLNLPINTGTSDMSIEEKVRKLISEKLDVDYNEVVPKASLVDDLGADSLALVELIMTMEEEFDIEVPDDDAEKLITVENAINYIKEKSAS
jgi:acyl carrier protein